MWNVCAYFSLLISHECGCCFYLAVFGSYLRPDLVPANPSFYEGSSMGTISTSSIFVNVDNQTEDRYGIYLFTFLLFPTHCVDLEVELKTLKPWCKREYTAVLTTVLPRLTHKHTHTYAHTLPRYCHLCSDVVGDSHIHTFPTDGLYSYRMRGVMMGNVRQGRKNTPEVNQSMKRNICLCFNRNILTVECRLVELLPHIIS